MKNKKTARMGETRPNKQGLTMKIIKYINNKDVTIEFVETGEQQTVRYSQFVKGSPTANLLKYPANGECTFMQAIFFFVALSVLILSAIGGLIYWICK